SDATSSVADPAKSGVPGPVSMTPDAVIVDFSGRAAFDFAVVLVGRKYGTGGGGSSPTKTYAEPWNAFAPPAPSKAVSPSSDTSVANESPSTPSSAESFACIA